MGVRGQPLEVEFSFHCLGWLPQLGLFCVAANGFIHLTHLTSPVLDYLLLLEIQGLILYLLLSKPFFFFFFSVPRLGSKSSPRGQTSLLAICSQHFSLVFFICSAKGLAYSAASSLFLLVRCFSRHHLF